ncbi:MULTISPECIES: CHAT domain-containing protein [Actinosynnema]|uniref:CHAT domain-containing protein n=1 Tax=Actinosynnema TaxID=40566 RepID=UPI0020A3BDF7|nr:CHAT domain-containing protein [Actinosynnema pretiosum]MCP2094732.1 CHAT domain-containing protein [Actinosynnema pretiosum]
MLIAAKVLAAFGRATRAWHTPDPAKPVSAWIRRLAKWLDHGTSTWKKLPKDLDLEISELDGYFAGLCYANDRDMGSAGISVARAGMMRMFRDMSRSRSPLSKDTSMGRTYEVLARIYLRFGDWKLATDGFGYAAMFYGSVERRIRAYSLAILCQLMMEEHESASELLADMGEGAGYKRYFLRITRALADPTADVLDELDGLRATRWMGRDVYGYLVSLVVGRLTRDGHLNEAFEVLEEAWLHLDKPKADAWILADLRQRRAILLLKLGRPAEGRDEALVAWQFLDSIRYQACSHTQRQAAWRYCAPSRYVALRASIELADTTAVGVMIENCRLQSVIAAVVEVDTEESEKIPDEVNLRSERESDGSEDEPRQKAGGAEHHAGNSLFAALNDAFNATRLLAPAPVNAETLTLPPGAFWSTQIEQGVLFWFLAVDGEAIATGMSDLNEHVNLQPVLRALAGYSAASEPQWWSLPPYVPQPGDYYEPVQHLAEWKSPEEQIISSTVGRLLPQPLVALLDRPPTGGSLRLTISAAREFAAVLWPIAVVPGSDDRLVERAVLRMWTSSTIESSRSARRTKTPSVVPFLLSCENPDGTLRDRAAASVAGAARVELHGLDATKDAILQALHEIGPSAPGIFFYSGHARNDVDPSYSTLPLAGEDYLRAGEFFGEFDDGTPFLPMPTHVILSCCSSSSGATLGGETIGLAAGIIKSGGQQVIATGVDVFDAPFTQALDDILVAEMLAPQADAATRLRGVQLRMLTEWKVYSLRGGIGYTEDIKDPHPIIWAAYQAF